jgi:peptidyl-prolyl cis-trans isomerase SurA
MAKVSDDTNNKKDTTEAVIPESSIVDEVIWVVGDAPILKSDVEMARMQGQTEGVVWNGDPDCLIPEQLAVQKLFLHQAEPLFRLSTTEKECRRLMLALLSSVMLLLRFVRLKATVAKAGSRSPRPT